MRGASLALAAYTGLLVVVVLVVSGGVLYLLYARAAGSAADRALSETVQRVRSPAQAPPGIAVAIVSPDGSLRFSRPAPAGFPDRAALAAVRRDGTERERTVDDDAEGRAFAVITARVDGQVVQAWQDRQPGDEAEERLLRAMLAAGGVGVVLAALVAAWLARRAVAPLTATVDLQRRFVADASHELRTPLTLLSTRAQLLARRLHGRGARADALVEEAEAVVSDARAMAEVLEELLTAADPGSPQDREVVDLASLAAAVVDSCTPYAAERQVVLALGVPPGGGEVLGLPSSLRRAVTAVVDNALDHAESRVEVTVTAAGRSVQVRVTDDGPGVAPEVMPSLFERFASDRERTPTTARRHYGLGLALVAEVVAAHGGRMGAGPGPAGRGAVFELTLPAARGQDRRAGPGMPDRRPNSAVEVRGPGSVDASSADRGSVDGVR